MLMDLQDKPNRTLNYLYSTAWIANNSKLCKTGFPFSFFCLFLNVFAGLLSRYEEEGDDEEGPFCKRLLHSHLCPVPGF